jgi:signal peptidase I
MHGVNVDDAGGDPIAPRAGVTGTLHTEPMTTSADALPSKKDPDDGRVRNLVEWGVIILIAVVFAFLVRGFAFQTFYIPSESMVPRLQTDDRVLVNKLTYDLRDPARGDVVVFRTPPGSNITGMDDLVKRIVGMPGDNIEGHDGHIYIDGKLLKEPYLDANVQSKTFAAVHVPANSYFMLGDNRQFSNDSTVWGPAKRDLFVGPVFVTIWPLDRIDVPGWVWVIPIAAGIGGVGYLVLRRRDRRTAV